MSRKLIFLDVDGTLCPPGTNRVPESAVRAIRAARERGHQLFLCSGRNRGMLSTLLELGFDGAVASAGGYVFLGERLLFDCPMTEGQRIAAMETLKAGGVFRTLEARDAAYADEGLAPFLASSGSSGSVAESWQRTAERELRIRPMGEYDGSPLYKIVFLCQRPEQLDPARAALSGEFRFVVQDKSDNGFINGELINRKFHKGSGVRRIARALGAELEDTVGFGDSMNDREMMETVGLSVCMGNGSPLLKSISRMAAPPVERDGLAAAFEALGLTK